MYNHQELKKDLYRYVKFLFGGSLSLILNLLITYLLTEFFFLWFMLSFAIALGVEIIFLFTYHSIFTFHKRGKFLLFVVVILLISGLNWIFVYIFSVLLGVPYIIAIILVAGVISIFNYFLNKKIVFR